ncbi:discoidin domain-containing protein [Georgenia sp. TF02-10]|uniref:discoidin domain-containing protein n=1 Tax=Georgenia sp. TF02-10 TaxID=2917725 RepID=UPI001FA80516|nr:discoidin domain-containing protein [Georgenia sp. TF02-10]UNX54461.1 discoidin domain-containing protein [Georgenia sp. TF02-10]
MPLGKANVVREGTETVVMVPNEHVGADYYKKLLYWNAWAHYIDGDNRLPDQNEFWNTATANTEWGDEQGIGYRSWIHHTILVTTNFTMIEDAMGLRPRSDAKIELDPIDIDWPYFTADNIRYRDRDLTVVWDEPGDGERPYGEGVPEGYSVFLDGDLALTVDSLGRVVFDPATGEVEETGDGVTEVYSTALDVQAPEEVRFDDEDRVVDIFAKAGQGITTGTTNVPNLAEGADVTATYTQNASYSSPEAAVNGTTINEPFWGTLGSPNAEDSLTIDLGDAQAVDEVRLYFYRTSSSDNPQGGRLAGTRPGYAAPSMYSVEYHDGSEWRAGPGQAKTPVYPRGNYNLVQFPEGLDESAASHRDPRARLPYGDQGGPGPPHRCRGTGGQQLGAERAGGRRPRLSSSQFRTPHRHRARRRTARW